MTEGWRDRVGAELAQLEDRMNALGNFIGTNAYYNLDAGHRVYMMMQLQAMTTYKYALDGRLGRVVI